MALLALLSLTYICYAYATLLPPAPHYELREVDLDSQIPSLGVPRSVQQSWVMYSPYFAAEQYLPPPKGCKVDQVHILERHGARFPTDGASDRIMQGITKLQSVEAYTDPMLAFLDDYTYDLGVATLVPLGAAQSFQSGQLAFRRYPSLFNSTQQPFVRTSGSERVVDSATNWTAGFAAASSHHYNPAVSVIISEESNSNNTLDDNMCPSAGDPDPQTDEWLAIWAPPMTARLNAGAPGANLTDADTYNLLSLCAFETVAHERRSPWCGVYEELGAGPAFAYNGDLDKFYGTGYGQPLGRVQGVGYINELIARLTGTPVRDHTQTNTTLDIDPATFPFGRTMYADFSHDNQMIAIFAAMGLFEQPRPLDPTKPDPRRTWHVEKMVPFSARMVVERLDCRGRASVRVLVNDALMPLKFCGAKGDGVCELGAFVESQTYARNDGEGDFEKCFE
ncbi:phytase [Earliella scabrosa]|nr:phytase [Earliella scabrosa]